VPHRRNQVSICETNANGITTLFFEGASAALRDLLGVRPVRSAGGLRQDDEFHPPILLTPTHRIVRGNGVRFPVPDGGDARGVDTLLLDEVIRDRVSASQRERFVVGPAGVLDWLVVGVIAIPLLVYLTKKFLPWQSLISYLIFVALATAGFYGLIDWRFAFDNPLIFFQELVYNLLFGGLVYMILARFYSR